MPRQLITALLCLATLGGCQSMLKSLAPPMGFVTGSRPLAYQSYAFIYSFAAANNRQLNASLGRVDQDLLPFLDALNAGGHHLEVVVEPQRTSDGTEHYWVHADVTPKGGKRAIRLPGAAGTDPTVHAAATARLAKRTGIAQSVLTQGHFAIFGLVNTLTGLNVETDTLRKHAFALLTVKAKTEAGQKADWYGQRPPSETLKDVDYALALIEDDANRVAEAQAQILALFAMAANATSQADVQRLSAQVARARDACAKWDATHRRPTNQDFGVAWQAPTPDAVLKSLEARFGFVGTALKLAKNVVTGNVGGTLQSLGALCPEGSDAQTILAGLGAAASGDIQGTIDAIATISGTSEAVDGVKQQLGEFKQALRQGSRLRK